MTNFDFSNTDSWNLLEDLARALNITQAEAVRLMASVLVEMHRDGECVCGSAEHERHCPASADFPVYLFGEKAQSAPIGGERCFVQ